MSKLRAVLPTGMIFSAVRKLVRPLLDWVLRRATGLLPNSLRPAATALATTLRARAGQPLGETVEEAADGLDELLAASVLTPGEPVDRERPEAQAGCQHVSVAHEPTGLGLAIDR
jgi:hypothetical protein